MVVTGGFRTLRGRIAAQARPLGWAGGQDRPPAFSPRRRAACDPRGVRGPPSAGPLSIGDARAAARAAPSHRVSPIGVLHVSAHRAEIRAPALRDSGLPCEAGCESVDSPALGTREPRRHGGVLSMRSGCPLRRCSAGALACSPRTLLGGNCATLTPGLPLVPRVHIVEVRDVLGGRMIAGVSASGGVQRLRSDPYAFGRPVHMS